MGDIDFFLPPSVNISSPKFFETEINAYFTGLNTLRIDETFKYPVSEQACNYNRNLSGTLVTYDGDHIDSLEWMEWENGT
jgi:hypothetical protein